MPFFLFLSFHRPHPPLDPPAWAYQQYLDMDLPDPPIGDWVDDLVAPNFNSLNPMQSAKAWPRDKIRRARAAYYGQLTHIDHQIHRFLEVLQEHRLHDNTYVCFTSDHGDMLGDHHQYAKSYPYEGSTNIPMVLAGPRASGVRQAATVDRVVELRDVMPTLLDCAGLPIPESVEGRSFLPLARGEAIDWRDYLHGEHTLPGQSAQFITDDRWKYIWFSGDGREQLFDLKEDPKELRDLAGQPVVADVLARLRGGLVESLTGREEGFIDDGRLVPGRPVRHILSHLEKQDS
jgi:arylsulfatase A-like enzyme